MRYILNMDGKSLSEPRKVERKKPNPILFHYIIFFVCSLRISQLTYTQILRKRYSDMVNLTSLFQYISHTDTHTSISIVVCYLFYAVRNQFNTAHHITVVLNFVHNSLGAKERERASERAKKNPTLYTYCASPLAIWSVQLRCVVLSTALSLLKKAKKERTYHFIMIYFQFLFY